MPKTMEYAPIHNTRATAPAPGRKRAQPAEDDRQHSGGGQPPFVLDLLTEPDGRDDLEHAAEDGPRADHVYERERARGRARRKATTPAAILIGLEDSAHHGPPVPPPDGRDDGKAAIDDGVAPEQEDEREQGDTGHERGQNAEDDGEHSAKGEDPPVLGQGRHVQLDSRFHVDSPCGRVQVGYERESRRATQRHVMSPSCSRASSSSTA